MIIDFNFYIYL